MSYIFAYSLKELTQSADEMCRRYICFWEPICGLIILWNRCFFLQFGRFTWINGTRNFKATKISDCVFYKIDFIESGDFYLPHLHSWHILRGPSRQNESRCRIFFIGEKLSLGFGCSHAKRLWAWEHENPLKWGVYMYYRYSFVHFFKTLRAFFSAPK